MFTSVVIRMARLNSRLDPKLTDLVISILESKKIYTVFDLVSEDSEKIMQLTSLSYQEILDLKQKITSSYIGGIKNGSELLKTNYNNVTRTEIQSLDNLLKGGLRGGEIYEICGIPSSGKSQLCHTLAINIAQKFKGIVHYIDTKGDFSAKRTVAIMKNKKLQEDHQCLILDNIIVTRIEKAEELMNFLHSIIKELKIKSEINKPLKLVIIDSLPAVFFNCEMDSFSYSSQSCALNHFSNAIKCIASEFNVPLITVNLISEWRGHMSFTDVVKAPLLRKPSLGKYWVSVPNNRLFIKTIDSEKREISVWKSSALSSDRSCLVNITNSGVV